MSKPVLILAVLTALAGCQPNGMSLVQSSKSGAVPHPMHEMRMDLPGTF